MLIVLRAKPPGRGGYWGLWVAASLHWLAVLEGIRRPYWALHFGWAALSLYMAFYVVLFVGSCRALVHHWRWPIWIAAPLSWVGWELARGHALTGFSGALLAHSQARWTQLIQIADLGGAYTVSFVIMTVAACCAWALAERRWKTTIQAVAISSIFLAMTLGYGYFRWQTRIPFNRQPVKVALLQGTYNTVFERNRPRTQKMFEQYLRLVKQAAYERPDLDLIVWPESTFTEFLPRLVRQKKNQNGDSLQFDERKFARLVEDFQRKCRTISRLVQHPSDDGNERHIQQLVGVEVIDVGTTPESYYNSCLLLDTDGDVLGRYDKNHLVMFGEYIPFAKQWSWLAKITPIGAGLDAGRRVASRRYRRHPCRMNLRQGSRRRLRGRSCPRAHSDSGRRGR
jgi:apolipoprotein N-acyltransferase